MATEVLAAVLNVGKGKCSIAWHHLRGLGDANSLPMGAVLDLDLCDPRVEYTPFLTMLTKIPSTQTNTNSNTRLGGPHQKLANRYSRLNSPLRRSLPNKRHILPHSKYPRHPPKITKRTPLVRPSSYTPPVTTNNSLSPRPS